jgi:hypothetical protein
MKKTTLFTVLMMIGFVTNIKSQSITTISAMTLIENTSLSFGSSLLLNALGRTIELLLNSTIRVYPFGIITSAVTLTYK